MKQIIEKVTDWYDDFTIDHPIIAGALGGWCIGMSINVVVIGLSKLIQKTKN